MQVFEALGLRHSDTGIFLKIIFLPDCIYGLGLRVSVWGIFDGDSGKMAFALTMMALGS